jgi:hypothetical protein
MVAPSIEYMRVPVRSPAAAVGEGADRCSFVGVEVGDGFVSELPGLVGGGVVVEDELICAGVEREGESSDDVEGRLCFALLIVADL